MEARYGPCGSELLAPLTEALIAIDPARDLQPESANLRTLVNQLRASAFALSDQLTHRFFTHARGSTLATLGM